MGVNHKFEKIELIVISIDGLRPNLSSNVHLEVRSGEQVHKTTSIKGVARHTWNQKFSFDSLSSRDLLLTLYRTRPFSPPVLISNVTVRTGSEPWNEDLVKTFPSLNQFGPSMTVTYRLQEPKDGMVPVFAFIIGINQYQSNRIRNLEGCENDAQTVKTFLIDRFHIPESHIVLLLNTDATRNAILENFQTHLIDNPCIQPDDLIIIYYAGHGSRAQAPHSWPSTDGMIETVVPYDERTKGPDGQDIHGIPDRTINMLLSRLATAKGNNVVAIFDCCHSGGITRRVDSDWNSFRVRSIPTPRPIPENLDRTLRDALPEHVDLPPGIRQEFTQSHVLLAACRQQQQARECLSEAGEPCGFFTDSLIQQLRESKSKGITYAQLLELLPTLPDQNPQCEGANIDRFVFDFERRAHDPMAHAFTTRGDGKFEVDTGSMYGVVAGTQFVFEGDAGGGREPQLVLVAVSVNLGSSILFPTVPLKQDFVFPEGTRLVVSDWKSDAAMMKVYVHASESPQLGISDISVQRMRPKVHLVESLDNADLAVRRTSEETFSITRLDPKLSRYGMPDVELLNVPVQDLPYELDAVAQFNYFLGRHNANDPLGNEVKLEMYTLSGEHGTLLPHLDVGNLLVDNEARFCLDPKAKYGFAICNYSQYDLFPYLFYFDPATYSIDGWFLPQSPNMLPPLGVKCSPEPTRITVGYGAGGGYPFRFTIPEGMTFHTGFLKLFVSTKYLDLKRIEQPKAGGGKNSHAMDNEVWGALDVAVTKFTESLQSLRSN
ncbi:caspase domain-containing protein [Mycena epipterygia]|nr:caspase domain-containing protein [Mycena epipterygia]